MTEDATEIAFPGEGPFLLPECDGSVALGFSDEIAVLEFRTTDGQVVRIPLPRTAIPAIHDLTGEALVVMASGGPTLQ